MIAGCVRFAHALIAVFVVTALRHGDAQEIAFIQGVAHPAAAADFDHHDVAREMFLAQNDLRGKLHAEQEIPPDTLIDPDGKAVIDCRRRKQRKTADLAEEAELLNMVAKKNGEMLVKLQTWMFTMLGCASIVACGVAPAFLLPVDSGIFLQSSDGRKRLNLLLSFAVGSLLGDVFLHLLPEVWAGYQVNLLSAGIWTSSGLLFCFLIEKCCATTEDTQRKVCAVVNLIANFTDNFTHGLAVGGSFLVSAKFGLLTTFAIVVHELPHEISDFAILLRADFSRWSAVQAQLFTAVGGVMGAGVALYMHTGAVLGGAEWILPFTAGGFLNIALAQILPELMQETNPRQNALQLIFLLCGISIMGILNQFH